MQIDMKLAKNIIYRLKKNHMAENLNYLLVRSKRRRKTISVSIQKKDKIVIYAPHNTPGHLIDIFFKDKKSWINKKLSQRDPKLLKPKEFVSGEGFLYMGRTYPLEIQNLINRGSSLKFSARRFILHKKHKDNAKEFFIRWYKKEAKEKITERVKIYSRKLRVVPEALRITSAEQRWGSCSGKNILSFTWRLVMAPLPVIDYIVIHELLHIKEKNHSNKFWGLLETVMPDYKSRQQWLKNNGYHLTLY